MTDERINRALAEKVMGWEWIDYLHIKDENGNWIFDGSPFDPRNDANHALMVLEKFHGNNRTRDTKVELACKSYCVDTYDEECRDSIPIIQHWKSFCHAITDAIYEATKKEGKSDV